MLGFDAIGENAVAEVKLIDIILGTAEYAAPLPSLSFLFGPPGGGGGVVIPIIVWQLKQQGIS